MRHRLWIAATVLALGLASTPACAAPPQASVGASDQAESVAILKQRADKGNAGAQNTLGVMYHKGIGVPRNDGEAARLYRRAADQDHTKGQVNLGLLYYFGEGVPKSYEEAVRLFRLAASKGDDVAQFMLGNCYATAHGVARNDVEAARQFRLAADQGNAMAQNGLGRMYEQGLGVPRDPAEAMRLYRGAADQGNRAAKLNLTRLATSTPNMPPTATQPSATLDTFEVRLRRQRGVLVVPGSINGTVTVNFVVDSGAADVAVPESVAEALIRAGAIDDSDFLGKQTYILADGSKVASRTFRIRQLKVGDHVVENVKASIASGKSVALLGQSFLGRFKTWSIDNDRQLLVLRELPR